LKIKLAVVSQFDFEDVESFINQRQARCIPSCIFACTSQLVRVYRFSDAEASSRLIPTITTPSSPTTNSNFHYQNDPNVQNDGQHVVNANRDQYSSVELDYNDEDWSKNALDRGPFFELTSAKNITAIAGHTAYLNCRVRNLGNKTVSYEPQDNKENRSSKHSFLHNFLSKER
jgi:hypothetical protein